MEDMERLSAEEIGYQVLRINKAWTVEGIGIRRDFKFKNFVEAFSFMTAVALQVEKANHHPDWKNVYNKITIVLSTHEAGGLTTRDFELAQEIDKLAVNTFRID